MWNKSLVPNLDDQEGSKEPTPVRTQNQALVRIPKSIVVGSTVGKHIDQSVVNFRYYNAFNYSLLAKDKTNVRLTLGITSANAGEGKTLVASNLALSLTLGFQKRTVLVDLNIHRPKIHEIFGIGPGPGLLDALHTDSVNVTRTQVDNLSVLSAGSLRAKRPNGEQGNGHSQMGLESMGAFGDVIYSLQQEYDFVIVDMPPINTGNFPILFANQLDGLIVVIDAGRTKKEDLDKMFRQVNEQQVLGFVMNRVPDDHN